MKKVKVAFICVHNSCRSQIAEALMKKYGSDLVEAYSGGTELKDKINQDAVRLMKDLYSIDMEKDQKPKLIDDLPQVDYLITMGCNVICPVMPYTYKKADWGLDDPTGKSDQEFIKVIDQIDRKVKELIEEIKTKN